MKHKISIFDCYGKLLEEVKNDEIVFGIKLKPVGELFLGFRSFEISGDEKAIVTFLNHYELELDPMEN